MEECNQKRWYPGPKDFYFFIFLRMKWENQSHEAANASREAFLEMAPSERQL